MNVSRYFVTAAACLLVLSGCGGGPSGSEPTPTPIMAQVPSSDEKPPGGPTLEPGKFTDAKGLPFPVPSTEANPIVSVDRKTAWGDKLDIKEIPASIDADHMLILKAVSEDGKTIAGLVVPRPPVRPEQHKVVLMDVASRKITEIDTISDMGGRSYYRGPWHWIPVALDREWLLWQQDKTIHVYNRITQARSKIETATDIKSGVGGSHVPSLLSISVDSGTVVWVEASDEKPSEGKLSTVVKSADLATGSISIIGKHGVNPATSGSTVAWIEPDLTTEIEGEVETRLVALDLDTGANRVLAPYWSPHEIAIHRDAIASTGRGMGAGVAILTNLDETGRQVISPQQGSEPRGLTLNDRLVAWSGPYGMHVWDRKLERVVRLDGQGGDIGSAMIKGSTLAWESTPNYNSWLEYQSSNTLPNNMTIFVMDTSQLP